MLPEARRGHEARLHRVLRQQRPRRAAAGEVRGLARGPEAAAEGRRDAAVSGTVAKSGVKFFNFFYQIIRREASRDLATHLSSHHFIVYA